MNTDIRDKFCFVNETLCNITCAYYTYSDDISLFFT